MEVRKFAQRGGHLIGICNGFQILLEAGLLPGAMRRNDSLKYVCRDVHITSGERDDAVDAASTRRAT